MLLSAPATWSSGTQFWLTKTLPSCFTEMVSCLLFSGIFSGTLVSGRATSMPFCSIGVTTMKMISSTRQTSTRGVTLIWLFTSWTRLGLTRRGSIPTPLLHEEIDQLGGGVRHLDLQPLQLVGEVVEDPGRRNGDEEAQGRGHQRLGDAGRHRADTARAGQRHAGERLDDADDGAEQADERGERGDRRQAADAALEVGGGEQGGALDGAAGGLDDLDLRERAGRALVLERLQPCRHDPGEVALRVLHRRVDGGLRPVVLEVLGRQTGELERLPARLAEQQPALDGDVQRPDRQYDQDGHHALVDPRHVLPNRCGAKAGHALLLLVER